MVFKRSACKTASSAHSTANPTASAATTKSSRHRATVLRKSGSRPNSPTVLRRCALSALS
eukprot:2858809-Alexandrium_andersonii.AAC.1